MARGRGKKGDRRRFAYIRFFRPERVICKPSPRHNTQDPLSFFVSLHIFPLTSNSDSRTPQENEQSSGGGKGVKNIIVQYLAIEYNLKILIVKYSVPLLDLDSITRCCDASCCPHLRLRPRPRHRPVPREAPNLPPSKWPLPYSLCCREKAPAEPPCW